MLPDTPLAFLHAVSVCICILSAKVFHLVMGLFLKLSVDSLTADRIAPSAPYVNAMLFLVGRLLVAVSTQGFEVLQERYSQRVQRRFSVHAFSRLIHLPLNMDNGNDCRNIYQNGTVKTGTGDSVAVVRRGVAALDVLLRKLLFWLLPTVCETVYVSLIFCSLGSPSIAMITLLTVAVHTVYTAHMTSRRAVLARRVRNAQNVVWRHATERLSRAEQVCAHGMSVEETRVHDGLRETLQTDAYNAATLVTWFAVSADCTLQVGTAGCLLVAGLRAVDGTLSIGGFSLVVTYVSALFYPLLVLAQSYGDVVNALADVEQLVQAVETVVDVHIEAEKTDEEDCGNEPAAVEMQYLQEEEGVVDVRNANQSNTGVCFQNVSFSYNSAGAAKDGTSDTDDTHSNDSTAGFAIDFVSDSEENNRNSNVQAFEGIRNLSFHARPGHAVAFVGPSGSGKSTILSLIIGLHVPQHGSIMVNGHMTQASTYTLSSVSKSTIPKMAARIHANRRIGAILQDPTVFSGTVRDNVLYGGTHNADTDGKRNDIAVWRALDYAGLGQKVRTMPGGIDAVVDELGKDLSGGERQRIAVARAFALTDGEATGGPGEVLLADEATAALSPLDEQIVTREIRKRSQTHSVVVVAHRLKTVMFAGEIVVLQHGRVVERGTHKELLQKTNGLYRRMWRVQMSTNDEDNGVEEEDYV